jgi:hypothetical protein
MRNAALAEQPERPTDPIVEALRSALDAASSYEEVLDDVMSRYFLGAIHTSDVARLSTQARFFALIHTLRYEELPLDKQDEERLGSERMDALRRLHGKYYPALENLFDSAIAQDLYGIENRWTSVARQPLYHPDDQEILMRLRVLQGADEIFFSVDRVDSFLRLAAMILLRCKETLSYVPDQQLKLKGSQRESILSAIKQLEQACTQLADLAPSFGGESATTPAAESPPG